MQTQYLKIINSNGTEIGLLASGEGMEIDKNIEELPNTTKRQLREIKEGQQVGGGTITLNEIRPEDGFGELLYSLFGSVSTSGATPYTHTFTPGAIGSALPQVDVVKKVGNVNEYYTNCKVNELTMEAVANGTIEPEFTFVAKTADSTPSSTEASYDDSKVWNCDAGTVTVDGSSFDMAGIEFSFSNNIEDGDDTFAIDGTNKHAVMPEGNFDLELSMDVIANSTDMIDAFTGGTEKNIVVDIGDSPTELKLTVPRARITEYSKALEVGGGVLVEDISARALYDTGTGSDLCKAELINSISGYPRT